MRAPPARGAVQRLPCKPNGVSLSLNPLPDAGMPVRKGEMIAKLSGSLKEELVKYMIEYTVRTAGAHDHNFANSESLLIAFGKWKPEEGLTVHAFVANLVNGGYVLVEAGDPKVIASFVSKFTFWNDVKVVPVVDIGESVPIVGASLAWAKSASKP
jgi:hypothetical protein